MADHEVREPIHMPAVFRCRCPKCKTGRLFTNFIRTVDACAHCGLTLRYQDAGDGPAFFAITIVGFIVTILAAVVEIQYRPDYWLHAVLWLPLIMVLSIALLRVVKSYLIHLEYQLALLKEGDDDRTL